MRTLALFTALALAATAPCQKDFDAAGALFYRAYFEQHGLEQSERALEHYLEFLEKSGGHRMAGHAARSAIQILQKLERNDEAAKLNERFADALAESVPLGINDQFRKADAVARVVGRFESESREIFKHRTQIADAVGVEEGQAIADIGAGTGFFSNLFARRVGSEGRVYAVELGPAFVKHLGELADTMKLPQLHPVQCTETSTKLEPNSVDLAFICDTYHHFEHPAATLESLHRALRPGGQLIVVDFERIPGKTREWLLNHVRAGKDVFRDEIVSAGFRFVREEAADFLDENYILRFEKI